MGAEDVVVDEEGHVWTGTEDGSIFRISPEGSLRRIGNTGGRPLGLELPRRRAHPGLRRREGAAGDEPHHRGRRSGWPPRSTGSRSWSATTPPSPATATSGSPTPARSTRSSKWKSDFAEHTCTGRLLCRRADGRVEVHLTGLAFANGVALAADESFVCVAESGGRSVVRLWLTGERAGQRDFLVDDLPGYPDNIARGTDGLIWVTIASPYDRMLEVIRYRAPGAAAEARQPGPLEAAAQAAADRRGCRRTTSRAASCTTSTPTRRATTWSPASASTTATCGWAASRSRPSRCPGKGVTA